MNCFKNSIIIINTLVKTWPTTCVRKTSLTGPSVQETPTIDLTRLISLLWYLYLVCLSVMIGQTIGWKVYCNKLRAHASFSVFKNLKYDIIVLHRVFSGIMIKIKWHWNILIMQRNLFRLDSNPNCLLGETI